MTSKELLKMSVIVNASRVVEMLKKLSTADLNSNYFEESPQLKAELKAKMHELRRDTIRMEKVLMKWERR